MCCDSWGRKQSDTTERLNSTDYSLITHPKLYDIKYHVIILKSSVGQDFKQDMVIMTYFYPTMFRVSTRKM